MRRRLSAVAFAALVSAPLGARATAPAVFGQGPRSTGLAGSDVAAPDPTAAPQMNAAAATEPGFRLRLGYGYGAMDLTIDERDADVRNASGLALGGQFGASAGRSVDIGFALAAYFPDAYIARIAFRPGTEPQFVRYESNLQRTTVDAALALRWGVFSAGGGASMTLDVGGSGTRFELGQDARGTYADAAIDVELPYRVAPIAGLRVDLGRAALGAAYRGALGVDLRVDSVNTIALTDSPLNGTTRVLVTGVNGWDPATIAVGACVAIAGGLSAHAAFEYAVYSDAPPPVADVLLGVDLGTVPSQREVRFVLPRLRDTISPRIGFELRQPADGPARAAPSPDWRWALRAGYVYSPSPVPAQTGLTSYADADRHGAALGVGYRFGRAGGVDLSASAAGQVHVLPTREEKKADASLPHARYEVGGNIVYGALSLEGAWR